MTRPHTFRALMLAAVLVLGGCKSTKVIVVTAPPQENPPDGVVVHIDDRATIAEIDAARDLSFESHRHDHFKRIARRPNIGPNAQTHLIEQTYRQLSFENHKLDVTLALIDNEVFCADAKSAVLKHLKSLSFESHRLQVLRALDKRGEVFVFPASGHAQTLE